MVVGFTISLLVECQIQQTPVFAWPLSLNIEAEMIAGHVLP
jgi:hypothetical protein